MLKLGFYRVVVRINIEILVFSVRIISLFNVVGVWKEVSDSIINNRSIFRIYLFWISDIILGIVNRIGLNYVVVNVLYLEMLSLFNG